MMDRSENPELRRGSTGRDKSLQEMRRHMEAYLDGSDLGAAYTRYVYIVCMCILCVCVYCVYVYTYILCVCICIYIVYWN
jgi:hypothetical protein